MRATGRFVATLPSTVLVMALVCLPIGSIGQGFVDVGAVSIPSATSAWVPVHFLLWPGLTNATDETATVAGNGVRARYSNEGRAHGASFSCGSAAAAPNGDIYFTDRLNGRVCRMDPTGQLVSVLEGLHTPGEVAVDDSGTVFVTARGTRTLIRVDGAGPSVVSRADGIRNGELVTRARGSVVLRDEAGIEYAVRSDGMLRATGVVPGDTEGASVVSPGGSVVSGETGPHGNYIACDVSSGRIVRLSQQLGAR